ncbi:hypothetical protein ciss_20820 [Carboxydothermus islandicus]|uniref:Flagellar protein FlaG n=1 Tax=Carboxydothermus islandicus TaxID=661089 RepID=A0A1L8D4P8_9THEO|nr:flagellar protein FlaG [Carboxydothermus islandicus]GAV26149.1 hypothetical protein ciss_20820 [Carboxydothermus islandicus]
MNMNSIDPLKLTNVNLLKASAVEPVKNILNEPREEKNLETGNINKNQLEAAVEKLNKVVNSFTPTELKFEIHEDSKELMVKVINAETKEVIREIPPHQVLEIVAEIKKLLGILVDTKI